MTAWPGSLPSAPLAGTLSVSSEPNVAEFKPEVGGAIRRRRYTAQRVLYKAQMLLTGGQIETLRSFYHDDCFDGVLPFDVDDWWTITQGPPATVSVYWDEPPAFQHVMGDAWRASLNLYKVA